MEMLNAQVAYTGATELMNLKKTVFLCPFDATGEVFEEVRTWMRDLDPTAGAIVCGNSSGIERYTLRLLLNKGFAVIVPLATMIPENLEEFNLGWKLSNEESTSILNRAFDEHRLLLVASKQNVSVSLPTAQTLAIRDRWMLEAGDQYVVMQRRAGSYYDHLLTHMGWEIYRRLKESEGSLDRATVSALVSRYMALGIEHPSLLHSLMLMVIARQYSELADFDFMDFVRRWSFQNLRPEDWQHYRNKQGRYLPSLAESCLTRMMRRMPSRNLMSASYGQPYDAPLVHQWLDGALTRYPNNKRHLKSALRLAYYEHDGKLIDHYKKLLAV